MTILEEIRTRENEFKRRIARARADAERTLEDARREAQEIRDEAAAAGDEAGRTEAQKLLERTGEEIAAAEREAGAWADAFERTARDHMDRLIEEALAYVLGREAP